MCALGFAPRLHLGEFRTFWSAGTGWGTYRQVRSEEGNRVQLRVEYGELSLRELGVGLPVEGGPVRATVNGRPVEAAAGRGQRIAFAPGRNSQRPTCPQL